MNPLMKRMERTELIFRSHRLPAFLQKAQAAVHVLLVADGAVGLRQLGYRSDTSDHATIPDTGAIRAAPESRRKSRFLTSDSITHPVGSEDSSARFGRLRGGSTKEPDLLSVSDSNEKVRAIVGVACSRSIPTEASFLGMDDCRRSRMWQNRATSSGLARARHRSSAAWFSGRGRISTPPASHLDN